MDDLSQSGRFVYLNRPLKNPGTCCVCGSPNKPVVDFGANLHQRNSVWVLYLCVDCVHEAHEVMEIRSGRRAEQEAAASRSFESELEARNLVAISREQLDALIFCATDISSLVDSISSTDVEVEPETDSEPERNEPKDSIGFGLDDRESTEPVSAFTL